MMITLFAYYTYMIIKREQELLKEKSILQKIVDNKNQEFDLLFKSFDKNVIASRTDLDGRITYASEVIAPDGKTWFFHDHGGMVKWLEDKPFKQNAKIWVYAKDSKKWIDVKEAYFSQTDITPMEYGFGAYQKKQKNFINFQEMSIKMLRGENMSNPQIRQKLLKSKE